jgi:hypothetical protein
MSDTAREIQRLASQGLCCSQIMVQIGLDARQEENPELLNAVAGLCGGLYSGLCCGILTGAACLLSLFDKESAASTMIPKLVEWFRAAFSQSFGGINCEEILQNNPMNRLERCPSMMEKTIEKCRELLSEFGHEI